MSRMFDIDNWISSSKDRSVSVLVYALQQEFGEQISFVDHWKADRTAFGAVGNRPQRLLYVSTWSGKITYHVEPSSETNPGVVELRSDNSSLSELIVAAASLTNAN
jgi:hypothetical protein